MGIEQLTTKAFRVLPEGLKHRIITGWANETSFLNKLHEEFNGAPNFELEPCYDSQEAREVFSGERDGYFITMNRDQLINIHFTGGDIMRRKDLVKTEMGVGIYRLYGFLVFSENEVSMLLQKGVRVLPLEMKVKGLELNLVAFDIPLHCFSLQATGIKHPSVFTDSRLLLYNMENKEDRFAVRFLPENSFFS